MEQPEPPRKKLHPKTPRWSSPFWYLPIMLLLLWFWQGTIAQFSYRTIPYSEFKAHLQKHEVIRCLIREDDIQGEIQPTASPTTVKSNATTNAPAWTVSTNATGQRGRGPNETLSFPDYTS